MFEKIKRKILTNLKKVSLRLKNIKIGRHCYFGGVNFKGKATIEPYCRLIGDPEITIGNNFYMNANCHLLGNIFIGDDVMIGPKTVIWGRDHGIEPGKIIRKQSHSKEDIFIGNDVWIAANVTILKGISIGDGAVIGAGAVVTKNIPDNAIVVGNPAKILRYRGSIG